MIERINLYSLETPVTTFAYNIPHPVNQFSNLPAALQVVGNFTNNGEYANMQNEYLTISVTVQANNISHPVNKFSNLPAALQDVGNFTNDGEYEERVSHHLGDGQSIQCTSSY